MFGKKLHLFTLFGFKVGVDASWLIIAALVTWSLATSFFPYYYEGLPRSTYWWMGVIGALGLFASIIFHEFWHSYVAKLFGLPMKGITLFLFGGVSEMSNEPDNAKTEFFTAVAGPVSSIVLGFILYGLHILGQAGEWFTPALAVISYLAIINWVVAGFNLLPAFPLDGGRILRSILWSIKKDLRWATRWAANAGSFFGMLLIAFGLLNLFSANVVGGIWYLIIGMFLNGAAKASYKQLQIRKTLQGEQVKDFMITQPMTISPSISLKELVEDYVYRYHYKLFPVVDNGRLAGCITTKQIKEVPREDWETTSVQSIATQCSGDNTVSPDADVMDALQTMNQSDYSRLMVVEGNTLKGIIALKDIMSFLSLRLDLEGVERRAKRIE